MSDEHDVHGLESEEPCSPPPGSPVWKKHPRKIVGVIAGFAVVAAALVPVGPGAFAVEPGQGLIPTLDYQPSINLAEHCQVPLYLGRRQTPEYRITYEVARQLEARTDQVQVTAGVTAGQRFHPRRTFFGIGAWVSDACPDRADG